MSSPLRILHAINSDRFAGVEQFVRRLAIRQAQDGHSVTVLGGAAGQMRALLLDAGASWAPANSTTAVMTAVRRLLPTSDVVNTHMTSADLAAVVARGTSRARVPIIATRHFAQHRGSRGPGFLYRVAERRIDAEIAVSRVVADRIGVASTVIHPGVEPRALTDQSAREPTVLVAQRLQSEKHTDVAIRAFAASDIWQSGWRLDVAGDGPERDGLIALAADLAVSEHVRFLGFRSDLPSVMSRAGILIASSPFEGFGLTVLEAMAAGLPIVATDAPAHAEMLTGLDERAIFPAGDVAGAASRLRSLAGDPVARAELGRQEHERQGQQFSLRAQSDATEVVYRRAIDLMRRGT
jgi:glycosyltransferase involved in cell wall biosynthesis